MDTRQGIAVIRRNQISKARVKTLVNKMPIIRIEASKKRISFNFKELWEFRELLYFITWRDIKVRYQQTIIGASWAVFQPLVSMIVFTVIFGRFAKLPSDGIPYPVFAYSALLPWHFFSQSFNRIANSLVENSNLIKKVYFPRLLLPSTAAGAPAVDFFCSVLVLFPLLIWFDISITWNLLLMPVFLFFAFLTALGTGLWLSAINVKYRDVRHILPFLTQLWMFASPVVYPVSMIPDKWKAVYSLNPMVAVIEGFRWAFFAKKPPDLILTSISVAIIFVIFAGGMIFFKKMEKAFADVI